MGGYVLPAALTLSPIGPRVVVLCITKKSVIISGRSLITLAVLLALVLYAKASFWLRFVIAGGGNKDFSLSKVNNNNNDTTTTTTTTTRTSPSRR